MSGHVIAALGTLGWASSTGGAITAEDESVLAGQIPSLLAARARRPRDTLPDLDLSELGPPDSSLTRDADALWRSAAPPWLHAHGMRTWLFASALSRIEGLHADAELLYVACVLHDLGLTERYAPTETTPCFAVAGAQAARPVVARHRDAVAADTVAEAIAMHLNLQIDAADAGSIAFLVAAGTLVDVTGLRLQLLPRAFVTAVLRHHPRDAFGPAVGNALAERARRFPATRCGWLARTLNLDQLTRQNPLDVEATPDV